jgi:hypothetical protein
MYIGKTPTVGNFQVCDAISVVNGQAAYTLQVGGVNVAPESANHMLVSLNGILQKPGSSFTISGSTMTFASNLATGDVIDFVQILGNVLDIGQPSDDTVTAAKLNNNVISGQTALTAEPDDTDEFLVSDAGTIKRIDYSLIKGRDVVKIASTTLGSATANITFNSGINSTYNIYELHCTNIQGASDGVNVILQAATATDFGSAQNAYSTFWQQYANTSNTTGNANSSSLNAQNASSIPVADGVGNNTGEIAAGIIRIFSPSNTAEYKNFQSFFTTNKENAYYHLDTSAGYWTTTSALVAFRVELSSGNIASGATVTLYGYK